MDGSREGMFERQDVAACTGVWQGHIQNSSSLCAPGWRVCSWYDHHTLKSITWGEAMSVDGCYAYNAAQDGGRCRECRSDLEQVIIYLTAAKTSETVYIKYSKTGLLLACLEKH